MPNMTLAQRDLYLVRIEYEMNKKQQFLINKHRELDELEEDNEYLKLIRNDYQHYYSYIKEEKQKQIDAMNFLKSYIDEVIIQGKLTDADLEETKEEQDKILSEIDNIKQGLDEITENFSDQNRE